MTSFFRKTEDDNKPLSMRRRLKFTTVVLISQVMLIALAIAWLVHMIVIAAFGAVYFIEREPLILWIEISASLLITLFAVLVLIMQIKRLGERRRNDRDIS